MDKAAKFLIAENPQVDDGRVFIVHFRDPVIIAEAYHFEFDQEEEYMYYRSQFDFSATVDYPGELIVLGGVFFAPLPWKDQQEIADNLSKIMSRMGDWYHNYLKWEDNENQQIQ